MKLNYYPESRNLEHETIAFVLSQDATIWGGNGTSAPTGTTLIIGPEKPEMWSMNSPWNTPKLRAHREAEAVTICW